MTIHYLTESEAQQLHDKLAKVESLGDMLELMADTNTPEFYTPTGALLAYEACYYGNENGELEVGILFEACHTIEKLGITDMHNIFAIVTGKFFTKAFTCPIKPFLADCDYDTFAIWYTIAKKI